MIIWLDDIRRPPQRSAYIKDFGTSSFKWVHSVNEAIRLIEQTESLCQYEEYQGDCIDGIDLDHDLGDYAKDGGDGIKLLDWLEYTGLGHYTRFRIHTMNPVGRQNMEAIIEKNKWEKYEYGQKV